MHRFDHHILRESTGHPIILSEDKINGIVRRLRDEIPFLEDGVYLQPHRLHRCDDVFILIISVDKWYTPALCCYATVTEEIDTVLKYLTLDYPGATFTCSSRQ